VSGALFTSKFMLLKGFQMLPEFRMRLGRVEMGFLQAFIWTVLVSCESFSIAWRANGIGRLKHPIMREWRK
jgi:hypothetical protein